MALDRFVTSLHLSLKRLYSTTWRKGPVAVLGSGCMGHIIQGGHVFEIGMHVWKANYIFSHKTKNKSGIRSSCSEELIFHDLADGRPSLDLSRRYSRYRGGGGGVVMVESSSPIQRSEDTRCLRGAVRPSDR